MNYTDKQLHFLKGRGYTLDSNNTHYIKRIVDNKTDFEYGVIAINVLTLDNGAVCLGDPYFMPNEIITKYNMSILDFYILNKIADEVNFVKEEMDGIITNG